MPRQCDIPFAVLPPWCCLSTSGPCPTHRRQCRRRRRRCLRPASAASRSASTAPTMSAIFRPIVAGNVRIEGLYFDQQAIPPTDGRGPHRPRRHFRPKAIPSRRRPGSPITTAQARQASARRQPSTRALWRHQHRIRRRTAADRRNAGTDRRRRHPSGGPRITAGPPTNASYGVTLRYQPTPNFSFQPLFGQIEIGDEERPLIMPTALSCRRGSSGQKSSGRSGPTSKAPSRSSARVTRARWQDSTCLRLVPFETGRRQEFQ